MLTQVDQLIHVEVVKLCPDAELPQLHHQRFGDNELRLFYTSCRPMARFAPGMLQGSASKHDNCFSAEILHCEDDDPKPG